MFIQFSGAAPAECVFGNARGIKPPRDPPSDTATTNLTVSPSQFAPANLHNRVLFMIRIKQRSDVAVTVPIGFVDWR
jgi:hypothetical protein